MPNASIPPESPILDLTLASPSALQIRLLLPVVTVHLRNLSVKHRNYKPDFWEKQRLHHSPRNFLQEGLAHLKPETLRTDLTRCVATQSRRNQPLCHTVLSETTDATLLELTQLAAAMAPIHPR